MTDAEYKSLVNDVKQILWRELRGTIPPSIDIMRDFSFESAAEKAVNLCLERSKEHNADQ